MVSLDSCEAIDNGWRFVIRVGPIQYTAVGECIELGTFNSGRHIHMVWIDVPGLEWVTYLRPRWRDIRTDEGRKQTEWLA